MLTKGTRVRAAQALVESRPELDGKEGEVQWTEPNDQVVVAFVGLRKPYRCAVNNLEWENR